MNRARLASLKARALNALEELMGEEDVAVSYVKGSFTSSSCKLIFEFTEVQEDGSALGEDAQSWNLNAGSLGHTASHLNKWFFDRSQTVYKLIGYNRRYRTYPIIMQNLQGARLRFTVNSFSGMVRRGAYDTAVMAQDARVLWLGSMAGRGTPARTPEAIAAPPRHPTFPAAGSVTGRIAGQPSHNIHLQLARAEQIMDTSSLLSSDYAEVEARVLAQVATDPVNPGAIVPAPMPSPPKKRRRLINL